jgi:type I restriction-modification system DNA methylase subunit
MVALPGQLFYSTPIPVCLWFLRRDKRRLPSPPGRATVIEVKRFFHDVRPNESDHAAWR